MKRVMVLVVVIGAFCAIGADPAGGGRPKVTVATVAEQLERCGYLPGLEGRLAGQTLAEDAELDGRPVRLVRYFLDADSGLPAVAVYTDRASGTHFLGLDVTVYARPLARPPTADDTVQHARHGRMVNLLLSRLAGKSIYKVKARTPTATTLPGFELIVTPRRGAWLYRIRRRSE